MEVDIRGCLESACSATIRLVWPGTEARRTLVIRRFVIVCGAEMLRGASLVNHVVAGTSGGGVPRCAKPFLQRSGWWIDLITESARDVQPGQNDIK